MAGGDLIGDFTPILQEVYMKAESLEYYINAIPELTFGDLFDIMKDMEERQLKVHFHDEHPAIIVYSGDLQVAIKEFEDAVS